MAAYFLSCYDEVNSNTIFWFKRYFIMKLKLTLFIALSLLASSLQARTSLVQSDRTVSKLEARHITLKMHGRTAQILSNRRIRSCQRVVIKTKKGNRETIKFCKSNKKSKSKAAPTKLKKSRNAHIKIKK